MVRTKQKVDSKAKSTPRKAQTSASKRAHKSKKQTCLDLLSRPQGVSLADLQKATGWQRHSVRGFLSGTVRKMPGIALTSDTSDKGPRHYHIVDRRKRAGS